MIAHTNHKSVSNLMCTRIDLVFLEFVWESKNTDDKLRAYTHSF